MPVAIPTRKHRLKEHHRRMVEDNLGLLGPLLDAPHLQPYIRILGFDDARQIAGIALCRAARAYRPSKGAFGTYAGWWVRGLLSRAASSAGASLMRDNANLLANGRLGIRQVEPLPDGDFLDQRARRQRDPADVVADRIDAANAVSCLTKRERVIVLMRSEGFHYSEIGDRLGVSHERVSQIYKAAVSRCVCGRRPKKSRGQWHP